MILSSNAYRMEDFNDTDQDNWFEEFDNPIKESPPPNTYNVGTGDNQAAAADFSALNVPFDDYCAVVENVFEHQLHDLQQQQTSSSNAAVPAATSFSQQNTASGLSQNDCDFQTLHSFNPSSYIAQSQVNESGSSGPALVEPMGKNGSGQIESAFLNCPPTTAASGFGGECFPVDLTNQGWVEHGRTSQSTQPQQYFPNQNSSNTPVDTRSSPPNPGQQLLFHPQSQHMITSDSADRVESSSRNSNNGMLMQTPLKNGAENPALNYHQPQQVQIDQPPVQQIIYLEQPQFQNTQQQQISRNNFGAAEASGSYQSVQEYLKQQQLQQNSQQQSTYIDLNSHGQGREFMAQQQQLVHHKISQNSRPPQSRQKPQQQIPHQPQQVSLPNPVISSAVVPQPQFSEISTPPPLPQKKPPNAKQKSTGNRRTPSVSRLRQQLPNEPRTLGDVAQTFDSSRSSRVEVRFDPNNAAEFAQLMGRVTQLQEQSQSGLNVAEELDDLERQIKKLLTTATPTAQPTVISPPANLVPMDQPPPVIIVPPPLTQFDPTPNHPGLQQQFHTPVSAPQPSQPRPQKPRSAPRSKKQPVVSAKPPPIESVERPAMSVQLLGDFSPAIQPLPSTSAAAAPPLPPPQTQVRRGGAGRAGQRQRLQQQRINMPQPSLSLGQIPGTATLNGAILDGSPAATTIILDYNGQQFAAGNFAVTSTGAFQIATPPPNAVFSSASTSLQNPSQLPIAFLPFPHGPGPKIEQFLPPELGHQSVGEKHQVLANSRQQNPATIVDSPTSSALAQQHFVVYSSNPGQTMARGPTESNLAMPLIAIPSSSAAAVKQPTQKARNPRARTNNGPKGRTAAVILEDVKPLIAPKARTPTPPPPPPMVPSPAELARRVEKRGESLAAYFTSLHDSLPSLDTRRPFSSRIDCVKRLLPFAFSLEPELSPEFFIKVDHELLRHSVQMDQRKKAAESKMREFLFREALGEKTFDAELNMLLFLDNEFERRENSSTSGKELSSNRLQPTGEAAGSSTGFDSLSGKNTVPSEKPSTSIKSELGEEDDQLPISAELSKPASARRLMMEHEYADFDHQFYLRPISPFSPTPPPREEAQSPSSSDENSSSFSYEEDDDEFSHRERPISLTPSISSSKPSESPEKIPPQTGRVVVPLAPYPSKISILVEALKYATSNLGNRNNNDPQVTVIPEVTVAGTLPTTTPKDENKISAEISRPMEVFRSTANQDYCSTQSTITQGGSEALTRKFDQIQQVVTVQKSVDTPQKSNVASETTVAVVKPFSLPQDTVAGIKLFAPLQRNAITAPQFAVAVSKLAESSSVAPQGAVAVSTLVETPQKSFLAPHGTVAVTTLAETPQKNSIAPQRTISVSKLVETPQKSSVVRQSTVAESILPSIPAKLSPIDAIIPPLLEARPSNQLKTIVEEIPMKNVVKLKQEPYIMEVPVPMKSRAFAGMEQSDEDEEEGGKIRPAEQVQKLPQRVKLTIKLNRGGEKLPETKKPSDEKGREKQERKRLKKEKREKRERRREEREKQTSDDRLKVFQLKEETVPSTAAPAMHIPPAETRNGTGGGGLKLRISKQLLSARVGEPTINKLTTAVVSVPANEPKKRGRRKKEPLQQQKLAQDPTLNLAEEHFLKSPQKRRKKQTVSTVEQEVMPPLKVPRLKIKIGGGNIASSVNGLNPPIIPPSTSNDNAVVNGVQHHQQKPPLITTPTTPLSPPPVINASVPSFCATRIQFSPCNSDEEDSRLRSQTLNVLTKLF